MVFAFHLVGRYVPGGWIGVDVFFALSGYLLARPFIAAFHRGERLPAVGRYLVNRVLRIVPAFWAVVLVCLAVFGTRGSDSSEVLAVFAFLQTYDEGRFTYVVLQAWTLGAEMLFYLLIPVAAIALTSTLGRLRPGRARLVAVTAVLSTALAASLVACLTGGPILRPEPPLMLFAFGPGILLAAIEVLRAPRWSGAAWGPAVATGVALLGALILGVAAFGAQRDDMQAQVLLATAGCSLLVAGALLLQWTRGSAWRWLNNRPMHYLGERSYAIYLVHVPILVKIGDAFDDHGAWGRTLRLGLVALPLILLTSELLHRVVEQPFLRLRTRWRRPAGRNIAQQPSRP
jgi:peptidoglycan/LPS O-acetylase OafA/YrhL